VSVRRALIFAPTEKGREKKKRKEDKTAVISEKNKREKKRMITPFLLLSSPFPYDGNEGSEKRSFIFIPSSPPRCGATKGKRRERELPFQGDDTHFLLHAQTLRPRRKKEGKGRRPSKDHHFSNIPGDEGREEKGGGKIIAGSFPAH